MAALNSRAALLVPVASKTHSPADLSGKKVAVLPGTITEGALRSILTRRAIDATVVLVKDHKDGFAAITDGRAHACASDPILISLAVKATNPRLFRLAGTIFSYEPYALMVRRNDADFRRGADLQILPNLGHLQTLVRSVGVAPSDLLVALYTMQSISE